MVVEVSRDSKLSDRSMKKMWFLLELHHLVITQFMGLNTMAQVEFDAGQSSNCPWSKPK
jgi:hypothetical protein